MKRMLVFFLMLVLFSSHFQTIFAAFQEEEPPIDVLLPRIQEIFEARTEIWNNLLSESEEKNLTEVQQKLRNYVDGPLLEEDLITYQQMVKYPTSFEKIKSFRIDECSPLELSDGVMKLHMNIVWELEGYEKDSSESVNYFVELSQKNDQWYLRDYRVARYK